jgi:predicted enzyme related to lactoylglutathione lyase
VSGKTAAAAPHEGVFSKMLGRIKPLFRQPLDPRVKHMVEVFGEQAVKNLIAAFRNTRETATAELNDALKRAEALAPPPAHGTFVWHELMTRDVPAARRFYADLFGWAQRDVEMMPDFNYTIMRHISKDVAGLMAITPEQGDMPPGWLVYVAVDDVDSAADKAEALGGEIVVPAHDIPVGRWAMLKDPTGATICVYKARA